ncbi:pilus assembly protein TadG-related protein [Consotaella salsifontis]|uniref:Flp pilus assembly protein TadG n=1 Tax=Consotaella salsifontis TaxID=1365950 RepID=A0A1T4T774_9HYPH|nr:TadE/TadG family type IV pilus assembly protein [Consotaella salsifontis]SKA36355.1 Flp pilus assembly protein TadG [Consotaella salsifontis]
MAAFRSSELLLAGLRRLFRGSGVADAAPSLAARGWRDERGSVVPLIAISSLALIGCMGFAIDGARLMLMNSTLQSAVDAAGLSTVAKLETTAVDETVRKFADANFSSGYVGANIVSIEHNLSSDGNTLELTAKAEAPTVFMKLFGTDKITTSVSTLIKRKVSGLELAMVLDVTGSMNDNGKLAGLKSAANDLLNILYGDSSTAERIHVGIVPFSKMVNVGKTNHTSWMTSTSGWSGCVEARTEGRDLTDDPPSVAKFTPSTSSCSPAITPLTTSKAKLSSAINSLSAGGNTVINFGAVWGWRLLSPRWRGLWGGEMNNNNLPLDYDYTKTGMYKALILMTDGKNEISASGTAYGKLDCTSYNWWGDCNGTYKTDERLNMTGTLNQINGELDSRLSKVCTSMKNAGVLVYTIAFGNPAYSSKSLLRDCATQPSYFFDSVTTSDLKVAFAQIGDSLANLHIAR